MRDLNCLPSEIMSVAKKNFDFKINGDRDEIAERILLPILTPGIEVRTSPLSNFFAPRNILSL